MVSTNDLKLFSFAYIYVHENLTGQEKIQLMEYVKRADRYQVIHLLTTGSPVTHLSETYQVLVEDTFRESPLYDLLEQLPAQYEDPYEVKERKPEPKPGTRERQALKGGEPPIMGQLSGLVGGSKEKTPLTHLQGLTGTDTGPAKKPGMFSGIKSAIDKKAHELSQWAINKGWSYPQLRDYMEKKGMKPDLMTRVSTFWKEHKPLAGLGAAAVVAAGLTAAYKIWKNYLSQNARLCGKLSGGEKSRCIEDLKAKGNQARLNALMKYSAQCNKSKDPEACKQKFGAEASKLKAS